MVSLPVRVVAGVVGRPELECWFQSSSGWNGVVRGGGAGGSCKCNKEWWEESNTGGWRGSSGLLMSIIELAVGCRMDCFRLMVIQ